MEESPHDKLTLTERLQAVVNGQMLGYLVDHANVIFYEIVETNEELVPLGPGDIRVPFSPGYAYFMLTEMPRGELDDAPQTD